MGVYDSSLGALLIGTWINMMLYMLEISEMIRIFIHFPNEGKTIRWLLIVVLIIDTVCTAFACGVVYIYCVTYWGQSMALELQYWPLSSMILATSFTAFLVQSYLIYRFYTFSHNIYLTCASLVVALGGLAGGFAVLVINLQHPRLEDRKVDIPPAITQLGLEAVCDIFLSLCLVYYLRRMESAFATTRSLLHRLAANAIQTGTVTSVLAIVTLLSFLTNPHSNLVIAFEFSLGRVYSLTLLYNLNQRRRHLGSEKDNSSGFPDRTHHGLGPTNPITLTEIHVQCDVQTDGEDAIKSYPGTMDDKPGLAPSARSSTFSAPNPALGHSPSFVSNRTNAY